MNRGGFVCSLFLEQELPHRPPTHFLCLDEWLLTRSSHWLQEQITCGKQTAADWKVPLAQACHSCVCARRRRCRLLRRIGRVMRVPARVRSIVYCWPPTPWVFLSYLSVCRSVLAPASLQATAVAALCDIPQVLVQGPPFVCHHNSISMASICSKQNQLVPRAILCVQHPTAAHPPCRAGSRKGATADGLDSPRARRGKLSHARVCRHFYSFSSSVSATRHATADGGRRTASNPPCGLLVPGAWPEGREAGRALIAGRLCMCGWRAARPGQYEQRA